MARPFQSYSPERGLRLGPYIHFAVATVFLSRFPLSTLPSSDSPLKAGNVHTYSLAALLLSVRSMDDAYRRCHHQPTPLHSSLFPLFFSIAYAGFVPSPSTCFLFLFLPFLDPFFLPSPYFSLSSSSIHLNVGVGGIDVCVYVHSSRIDLSTTIAWFSVWS